MVKSTMTLEELQRQDHDTLISIVVKLDDLKNDVKELKDGTATRIADHELRIKKMENLAIESQPGKNIPLIYENQRHIRELEEKQRTMTMLAGIIGSGLMFVLTQLPGWIRFLWPSVM